MAGVSAVDQDQIAIHHLVRIPVDYRTLGNVSVLDLMDRHRIKEQIEIGTIYPESIASHLQQDHSLIETWLHWSQDKRCSSGPFIVKTDEDGRSSYTVGHSTEGPELSYDCPVTACANFIYLEAVQWAKVD